MSIISSTFFRYCQNFTQKLQQSQIVRWIDTQTDRQTYIGGKVMQETSDFDIKLISLPWLSFLIIVFQPLVTIYWLVYDSMTLILGVFQK